MRPRVQLKMGGIRKVLRGAQPEVDRVAHRVAAPGGSLVRVVPKPHQYTARTYVETNGIRGARAQARDHLLERGLGS